MKKMTLFLIVSFIALTLISGCLEPSEEQEEAKPRLYRCLSWAENYTTMDQLLGACAEHLKMNESGLTYHWDGDAFVCEPNYVGGVMNHSNQVYVAECTGYVEAEIERA